MADENETPTPETETPEPETTGAEIETETPETETETPEGETEGGAEDLPSGEGQFERRPGEKTKPKAGEDPAAAAQKAKKPDHVADPIDENLNRRTRERIQGLIGMVKDRDKEITDTHSVIQAIQDTGATPEQFGYMLAYMKLVHSSKPEDLKSAARALNNELRAISLRLGEPVDGYDAVAGHPDLVTAVKEGRITPELAHEIARTREGRVDQGRNAQITRQQQEQQQQFEAARTAAVKELDELGVELQKQDPQYQAKYDILVPQLKTVFASIPPNQWKGRFLHEYVKLKLPSAAAAPAGGAANGKGGGQPLRPNAPAGGQRAEPKNLAEAMFGSPEWDRLTPGKN